MISIEHFLSNKYNISGTYVLASIVDIGGSSPRDPGTKMIIKSSGEIIDTLGGGKLEELVIQDSIKCIKEQTSCKKVYSLSALTGQCCGGVVEVFLEVLGKAPRLIIFGSGHVSIALSNIMKDTDFNVIAIDPRKDWCQKNTFANTYCLNHVNAFSKLEINSNDYICIMTYDHEQDYQILKKSFEVSPQYLGLIGSETKKQRFSNRLKNEHNEQYAMSVFEKCHCPIGLNLGGKSPGEVAISIGSQLLKHYYK